MSDKTLVERLREEAKTARDERGLPVYTPEKIEKLADAIEREYLPRPRFEDGEPVQFGDKFESAGIVGTVDYILKGNVEGCVIGRKEDSGCVTYQNGKRVKRPEPEVLDADGVPIRKGDTVWRTDEINGKSRIVKDFCKDGSVVTDYEGTIPVCVNQKHITHKQPDSLERIEEDAKLDTCAYFGHDESTCDGCRMAKRKVLPCDAEKALDLLRRQREVMERDHER